MARITDRTDWFEVWFDDKTSMINTMLSNIYADLEAGYRWDSSSIKKQKFDLMMYQEEFDRRLDEFKYMEDKDVNRWCYYDLKKRGAIE